MKTKVIHKYPLFYPDDGSFISVPKGSVLIEAGKQRGIVCLWFECPVMETIEPYEDNDDCFALGPFQRRFFKVFPTGATIDSDYTYRKTFFNEDKTLVWHVYERTS